MGIQQSFSLFFSVFCLFFLKTKKKMITLDQKNRKKMRRKKEKGVKNQARDKQKTNKRQKIQKFQSF